MSKENLTPLVMKRSNLAEDDDNLLEPIVINYKANKKKKKKDQSEEDTEDKPRYTSQLKDVQEMEGDMLQIARRASQSVTKGLDTYDKARKKSARTKKDGAIEDFPHNATKAVSEAMKEASEIPVDIVDALMTKNYRKQARKNLKRATRLIKVFRI